MHDVMIGDECGFALEHASSCSRLLEDIDFPCLKGAHLLFCFFFLFSLFFLSLRVRQQQPAL